MFVGQERGVDLKELGRGKYYDQNIFCFKQTKYLKNVNTNKLAYLDIINGLNL